MFHAKLVPPKYTGIFVILFGSKKLISAVFFPFRTNGLQRRKTNINKDRTSVVGSFYMNGGVC